MDDKRKTRGHTSGVKKMEDTRDESNVPEARAEQHQQQQDMNEPATFTKQEIKEIRSERLGLFERLDKLVNAMSNLENRLGSQMDQCNQNVLSLQKSMTETVKEEVQEATKDIATHLEERQEQFRDQMERTWDEKLRNMSVICEERNQQHINFLDQQAKGNREILDKQMQEHGEEYE